MQRAALGGGAGVAGTSLAQDIEALAFVAHRAGVLHPQQRGLSVLAGVLEHPGGLLQLPCFFQRHRRPNLGSEGGAAGQGTRRRPFARLAGQCRRFGDLRHATTIEHPTVGFHAPGTAAERASRPASPPIRPDPTPNWWGKSRGEPEQVGRPVLDPRG